MNGEVAMRKAMEHLYGQDSEGMKGFGAIQLDSDDEAKISALHGSASFVAAEPAVTEQESNQVFREASNTSLQM